MNSLTNRIQSLMRTQPDFHQKLKQRLVVESVKMANPFKFIETLLAAGVLHDGSNNPEARLNEIMVHLALTIACAEGSEAIGGLMEALEASENTQVISALETWIRDDFSSEATAGASLADKRLKVEETLAGPKFFEQAAPLTRFSKVAAFNSQSQSSGTGTLSLEFDKTRMIAHLADRTIKMWKWYDDDYDDVYTMEVGWSVNAGETITSFQYDEEILVVGTSYGTVVLCDPKTATFERKWSVRLGEAIDSLKFVGSSIVIRTRGLYDEEHCWFVEICRPKMQLLNQKLLPRQDTTASPKFFLDPLHIFLYCSRNVKIYETNSGKCVTFGQRFEEVNFLAPAVINTLHVLDLISNKRVVIAGCKNGEIAMWHTSNLKPKQHPFRTFQGHSKAIVSLCAIHEHLISLDQSGNLFMWSGYDLRNIYFAQPIPRVLTHNFHDVSCLVGCERWLASSSSKDGVINIWTLPEEWCRSG